MHYKNGRVAKIGDPVVGTCFNTLLAVTKIVVNPGSWTITAVSITDKSRMREIEHENR